MARGYTCETCGKAIVEPSRFQGIFQMLRFEEEEPDPENPEPAGKEPEIVERLYISLERADRCEECAIQDILVLRDRGYKTVMADVPNDEWQMKEEYPGQFANPLKGDR